MSKFKVINRFKDLQHGGLIYEVGHTYPAEGKQLVEERAEELTKIHPEYGVAFLEAVEDSKQDEKATETPKKSTRSTRKTSQKDAETPDKDEKSDE